MAGMFYSLEEVVEKLGKTTEDIEKLVREGKLREFQDGPNVLFKVDEVDALSGEIDLADTEKAEPTEVEPDDWIALAETSSEIPAIDESALGGELLKEESEGVELAGETTASTEGMDILGATETEFKLADDTMAETQADVDALKTGGDMFAEDLGIGTRTGTGTGDEASLEEIESDVSLDSFGSGSGLLDLSLQADDTSLGGILDEIYTPEGEGAEAGLGSGTAALGLPPETDILAETGHGAMQGTPMAAVYALEPEADTVSNAFGISLFLPLVALIYACIVIIAAKFEIMPSLLAPIKSYIWYVIGGAFVAAVLIAAVPAMMYSSGGTKTAKPKKEKPAKVKKEKASKVKKEKKKKDSSK
ncbi:MAG: hypothetical protein PHF37_04345 [Phycisphaerae bacterium]|nr:hypothetical protein [Phycisphaerae bacterium]